MAVCWTMDLHNASPHSSIHSCTWSLFYAIPRPNSHVIHLTNHLPSFGLNGKNLVFLKFDQLILIFFFILILH